MSDSSSDESEKEFDINSKVFHLTINNFRSKNYSKIGLDKLNNKKRSSSASTNLPKNFAPKLKPKKALFNPSPIILDEKPPQKIINENHNRTISTSSFDSKKDIIIKKIINKISCNLINEKVYAISDNEEDINNCINIGSDSDSSKNNDDNINNNVKLRSTPKIKDIQTMRFKMTKIRKNSVIDEFLDDSSIKNKFMPKKINKFHTLLKLFKNNFKKDLYSLSFIRNRNKSFSATTKMNYPILGFLERTKSDICLKSKES